MDKGLPVKCESGFQSRTHVKPRQASRKRERRDGPMEQTDWLGSPNKPALGSVGDPASVNKEWTRKISIVNRWPPCTHAHTCLSTHMRSCMHMCTNTTCVNTQKKQTNITF